MDTGDNVIAQTPRVRFKVPEMCERSRLPVKSVHPAAEGSHPENPFMVLTQSEYPGGAQAPRDRVVVCVAPECPRGAVKAVESASVCPRPEDT